MNSAKHPVTKILWLFTTSQSNWTGLGHILTMSTHQEAIRNAIVVRDLKALCIKKLGSDTANRLGKAVHSSYFVGHFH